MKNRVKKWKEKKVTFVTPQRRVGIWTVIWIRWCNQ
jgi:hypothetical protein